ncbi:hypothetical protein Ancab_023098 [Ancistrocladus abbreviatus]
MDRWKHMEQENIRKKVDKEDGKMNQKGGLRKPTFCYPIEAPYSMPFLAQPRCRLHPLCSLTKIVINSKYVLLASTIEPFSKLMLSLVVVTGEDLDNLEHLSQSSFKPTGGRGIRNGLLPFRFLTFDKRWEDETPSDSRSLLSHKLILVQD